MQGLGFAYAIAPLAAAEAEPGQRETSALLARHLQRFNTHPYMAAPIIGSVSRLEAENRFSETADLKNALMGPYAAIGDPFFWGAIGIPSSGAPSGRSQALRPSALRSRVFSLPRSCS